MEHEIKRFNLWSAAKVVFIIFLIIGILLSLFYLSFVTLIQNFIYDLSGGEFSEDFMLITGFTGIIISIFLSFFYAITATIFIVIILGLYNIIAGFVGGIKCELDTKTDESVQDKIQVENSTGE